MELTGDVSLKEISTAVRKLSDGKTSGQDDIPTEVTSLMVDI